MHAFAGPISTLLAVVLAVELSVSLLWNEVRAFVLRGVARKATHRPFLPPEIAMSGNEAVMFDRHVWMNQLPEDYGAYRLARAWLHSQQTMPNRSGITALATSGSHGR